MNIKLLLIPLALLVAVSVVSFAVFSPTDLSAQTNQTGGTGGTNQTGGTGGTNQTGGTGQDSGFSSGLVNPIKFDTLGELLIQLLKVALYVLYPVAVFFIVFAGFKFVTAGGSEDKIREAKQMFYWAVIGTAVLIGSQGILSLVQGTIENIVNVNF